MYILIDLVLLILVLIQLLLIGRGLTCRIEIESMFAVTLMLQCAGWGGQRFDIARGCFDSWEFTHSIVNSALVVSLGYV